MLRLIHGGAMGAVEKVERKRIDIGKANLPWYPNEAMETYADMANFAWSKKLPAPISHAKSEYRAILAIGKTDEWGRCRLAERWCRSERWTRSIIEIVKAESWVANRSTSSHLERCPDDVQDASSERPKVIQGRSKNVQRASKSDPRAPHENAENGLEMSKSDPGAIQDASSERPKVIQGRSKNVPTRARGDLNTPRHRSIDGEGEKDKEQKRQEDLAFSGREAKEGVPAPDKRTRAPSEWDHPEKDKVAAWLIRFGVKNPWPVLTKMQVEYGTHAAVAAWRECIQEEKIWGNWVVMLERIVSNLVGYSPLGCDKWIKTMPKAQMPKHDCARGAWGKSHFGCEVCRGLDNWEDKMNGHTHRWPGVDPIAILPEPEIE